MKKVAIITARGGSKRIPKKNMKQFCGQPIIVYSIQAALNSNLFDEVMVSTDSEEIAEIARKYGAKVPFMRSEKAADDYATTADVICEVLEEYQNIQRTFDCFCCLYPTAPFVTDKKLKNAFEKLMQTNADMVIPVVKFSYPPQRGFTIQKGVLEYKNKEYELARSQDLEPMYHDCGQFYFGQVATFLKERKLVCGKTVSLEIPELEVQDIDCLSDWKLAELKYTLFKSERGMAE